MSSESEKGVHEIAIFKAFCETLPNVEVSNINKCFPPAPDIHCLCNDQPTYFELARIYPKAVSQQVYDLALATDVVINEKDITRILEVKLGKHYVATDPIQLLLYDDIDIGLESQYVIKALKRKIEQMEKIQFQQIWYFAQGEALSIYEAS